MAKKKMVKKAPAKKHRRSQPASPEGVIRISSGIKAGLAAPSARLVKQRS
jgi:hypothetical protein